MISYSESLKILQQMLEKLRASTETIPVQNALFRVLASPVQANQANPNSSSAAMDGIAVDCMRIPDALVRLRADQWSFINTGDVLPEPFNAVIRIEDVNWEDKTPVLDKKPTLFQNVRRPGEDFDKGSLLLVSEHQIQAQDISLLLAAAIDQVTAYKKPVVTFIPTGSELIGAGDPQLPGKIRETNSAMIAGLVEQQWGGQFRVMDLVPDDADDLAQVLKLATTQSDVVIISAGTSKGTKDLTAEVVRLMGQVHFHGVQISPGKPVLFGEISGIPVLGLPGYPAAAFVCSYLYLRPIVCEISHVRFALPRTVFISAEELPARNHDAFHRVHCYEIEGQTFVRRIEGGASSIGSLSRMDGLMHVPPQTQIKKRDGVRIDVIQNRTGNTLAGRGIKDPGLAQLFSMLQRNLPTQRLLFWNSSGEDGLQSIVERNVHFATLRTPVEGIDLFETFEKQLQEKMHRYRALTRSMALYFKDPAHRELSKGMKIAVPCSHLQTWNDFLKSKSLQNEYFQVFTSAAEDQHLVDVFPSSNWDAIFVDLRYLQPNSDLMAWKEHLDIVIPDSYIELPGIRKMIELLLSDEFWMWIETQKGCDVTSRGLVE